MDTCVIWTPTSKTSFPQFFVFLMHFRKLLEIGHPFVFSFWKPLPLSCCKFPAILCRLATPWKCIVGLPHFCGRLAIKLQVSCKFVANVLQVPSKFVLSLPQSCKPVAGLLNFARNSLAALPQCCKWAADYWKFAAGLSQGHCRLAANLILVCFRSSANLLQIYHSLGSDFFQTFCSLGINFSQVFCSHVTNLLQKKQIELIGPRSFHSLGTIWSHFFCNKKYKFVTFFTVSVQIGLRYFATNRIN